MTPNLEILSLNSERLVSGWEDEEIEHTWDSGELGFGILITVGYFVLLIFVNNSNFRNLLTFLFR